MTDADLDRHLRDILACCCGISPNAGTITARDRLRLAVHELGGGGWREMADAPKDGRNVLLRYRHSPYPKIVHYYVTEAWWDLSGLPEDWSTADGCKLINGSRRLGPEFCALLSSQRCELKLRTEGCSP